MMVDEYVTLCATVACDIPIESPRVACYIFEKPRICTGRLAVDCVIRTHQPRNFPLEFTWFYTCSDLRRSDMYLRCKEWHAYLFHARLEGREVGVDQVLLCDIRVDSMSRQLHTTFHCVFHAISSVMLATGTGLQMRRILWIALKSLDKRHSILPGQVRVLYAQQPQKSSGLRGNVNKRSQGGRR